MSGVMGGSILTGVLSLGMEVEIQPRIVTKDSTRRKRCQPIYSWIVSLHAETDQPQFAVPSRLIGVSFEDRPGGLSCGLAGDLRRWHASSNITISFILTKRSYFWLSTGVRAVC